MAKYKVLEAFTHAPIGRDPNDPAGPFVEVEPGDVIADLHPDSVEGMLASGKVEEVPEKASSSKSEG